MEEGAISITKALWGKCVGVNGNTQKVNGDLTKVCYVRGLSDAAHLLLKNIAHTCRKLPGTQETRRLMRFMTQAYRIRYGTAIFITFSPDESHNLLMVRLSRTRRSDPVWQSEKREGCQRFADWKHPEVRTPSKESAVFSLSVDDVTRAVPTYDQRRKILATDSLASVEGFRVMVQLTLEHLFGIHYCPNCPSCNSCSNSSVPCQDLFGSSARAEGGIFGRVDAVFTSIEAQKSTGSLHAHSQVVIQCLHQHNPMWEIAAKLEEDFIRTKGVIFKEYLQYKAHVCRQVYCSDRETLDERLDIVESQWPEYTAATDLMGSPSYLEGSPYDFCDFCPSTDPSAFVAEGQAWLKSFLEEDVEELQMMKQHHVHLLNPETNKREPLPSCRGKANPKVCKANFPRFRWLVERTVVLCRGILKQMGLPARGKKCQLGGMHGPFSHESLNATHPAMLGAHRCNSDVQLPYRFPIMPETHCCEDPTCLQYSEKLMIEAMQVAQDAQAGYACDYCTKRQPMAFNECKECVKGHQKLAMDLKQESLNRIGKRHAQRIVSDAQNKAIVRAQVDNTNLRAYARTSDVTCAESINTCQTVSFLDIITWTS